MFGLLLGLRAPLKHSTANRPAGISLTVTEPSVGWGTFPRSAGMTNAIVLSPPAMMTGVVIAIFFPASFPPVM